MKASAMTYAIIFTLLVGLFCSGFIFLAAGQKNIQATQQNKEKALFNLFSIAKYALANDNLSSDFELVTINSDSCYVKETNWGAFHLIHLKSKKGKFELTKQILVGRENDEKLPSLYLSDNNKELKLTGKTVIKGTVFLPSKGVDRAYIEGKNFEGTELINGTKKQSEKSLPELKESIANFSVTEYVSSLAYTKIDELPEDSTFSFEYETTYFNSPLAVFIKGETLKGNLIIESSDSIIVSSDANLENVILISPVVRFESGFNGSVQVFSSESITLGKNTHLNYPSSLFLNDTDKSSKRSFDAFVELQEASTLLGGILILSSSPDFRNPVQLRIAEKSTVVGLVYNEGETDLKSSIFGSIYTNNFFLETKNASYGNYLMDAKIDNTILPSYFIFPDWLKEENVKKQVIKWM